MIRPRRASTLIEMLVVIALIGLLITLLIPSLKRSLDLARSTVCQYHLREIGTSLDMYRMENNGWLPNNTTVTAVPQSAPASGGPNGNVNNRSMQPWFLKLHPTYLSDPMILSCPEDPYAFRLAESRDALDHPAAADYLSYGINNFIMTAGGGFLANVDRYRPSRPLNTILVADLGPDDVRRDRPNPLGNGPSRNTSLMMWADGMDPFSGMAANPWVTMRHNHGINMLTLAGNVKPVTTRDVLASPIRRHYDQCAAGGCTLCNELGLFHYSFAKDQLFWWTGATPAR